jgi:hypothetical protein
MNRVESKGADPVIAIALEYWSELRGSAGGDAEWKLTNRYITISSQDAQE